MQRAFSGENVKILVGKEAADSVTSIRKKNGLAMSNKGLSFQHEVLAFQLSIFEEGIDYAKKHPLQTVVILNDRSMIDSFGSYLTDAEREAFNYEFFARFYNLFLLFKFSPSFLCEGGSANQNQYRYETTPDEYVQLAKEAEYTYLTSGLVADDMVFVVPPFVDLADKKAYVANTVFSHIKQRMTGGGDQ